MAALCIKVGSGVRIRGFGEEEDNFYFRCVYSTHETSM